MTDTCGVCGGQVAIKDVALPGGRVEKDWRHVTPAWHRPKLGTPLPEAEMARVFDSIRARRAELAAAKLPAAKPPIPAPLQRAVPADDLPTGAGRLRSAAIKAGWDVQATVAIGPWLTSDGTTASRLVHCWVLKFSRSTYVTQRAVASWVDGSDPLESPGFDGAYVLTPTVQQVSSSDLSDYLKADPTMTCLTQTRLVSRLRRNESDLAKLAKRGHSGNPPKNLPEQIADAKAAIAEVRTMVDNHGPATCETCATDASVTS